MADITELLERRAELGKSIPMFQIDPTPLTISEFWLRHASQVRKTALGRLRGQLLCTCSQKFRIRADPLRAYGSFRSG